jgi:2-amino-4-hydroxy-6-hydroxymethyldihydropteridine diphosphokinase
MTRIDVAAEPPPTRRAETPPPKEPRTNAAASTPPPLADSSSEHLAYVALGANLADPLTQVRAAGRALASLPECRLLRLSSLYRTVPVGSRTIRAQADFINAVAALHTRLSPAQLLDALFAIERLFGRRREYHHAPRTLDLDLPALR